MMRQSLDVEDTVLNQVLYVGNVHDNAPAGEVFLFYRDKADDAEIDSMEVKLAIINPYMSLEGSRLIENNCRVTAIQTGSVLENYLTALNDQPL